MTGEKGLVRIRTLRIGTAKEVGEVIAFLASDRAASITGAIIDANGGLHTR